MVLVRIPCKDGKVPVADVRQEKAYLATDTFASGILKIKGSLDDGKKTGVWIQYYEDGAIYIKETFKNDFPIVPWGLIKQRPIIFC